MFGIMQTYRSGSCVFYLTVQRFILSLSATNDRFVQSIKHLLCRDLNHAFECYSVLSFHLNFRKKRTCTQTLRTFQTQVYRVNKYTHQNTMSRMFNPDTLELCNWPGVYLIKLWSRFSPFLIELISKGLYLSLLQASLDNMQI